ncbi:TonB-dependent receptor plug domain-containing protein [Dyadobacter sandarakinus]|uniref:TonB-dependent receptor n=1 Tax=Dyadobacter sandarakinus TaxID=2747268 RepID=A0ABX7IAZ0_9BACT|nr:TonB-dependent receptor [Dyadobacter sandarakinus]QRR03296.1 TonB-dependent receptor [Dyadobacter sandarakinus]
MKSFYRNRQSVRALHFAACCLCFFTILKNENAAAQEVSLDPVTVTSSIIEKRASETGRNMAVIKGEYFKNLPIHSLDEMLRYIPGVEVQARGPQGSQSDIVLRGGTFQQVLVILDGMRLNDPNTGHFNSYIPIAPSEIERIEVLKGASSAIYGSDAVGGVIHVISKTFAAKLTGEDAPASLNTQAQAGAGAYGLWNAQAGVFYKQNKLAASAGLLTNNADGVQQRGTSGFFHNHTASASIRYALSPAWQIAARSSYDHRDFAAQNFYTVLKSDTASEKVKTSWNQLEIAYGQNRTTLRLDAGYKFVRDQYLFNPHAIANNSKSQLWQGLLTWQQELGKGTALSTGINFQNRSISSNDRGNHSLSQLAPFVSLSQKVGKFVTFSPSLRIDWRENIGTEAVPQLNFSFRKNSWQLRASAGKTIRDADFTERFNNYNKALVTGGNVGNPGLKAERSFSYEAGADWFLNRSNAYQLKISGTFFQRRQDNIIDYVSTPYAAMPRKENLSPSGTFGLARNIADVNTTGFEVDLQTISRIADRQTLVLNAGLTWLDSRSSEQVLSFYISSHAKVLTNFSAIYSAGNFTFSINGLYKQRAARGVSAIEAVISKSYFVLNARAAYGFLQKRMSVFVQADNALDKKYSDLLGSPMPGRWISGGLAFTWARP